MHRQKPKKQDKEEGVKGGKCRIYIAPQRVQSTVEHSV